MFYRGRLCMFIFENIGSYPYQAQHDLLKRNIMQCSFLSWNKICRKYNLPTHINSFQEINITSTGFLVEFNMVILKFIKKHKGSKIAKSLMEENRVGKLDLWAIRIYQEGAPEGFWGAGWEYTLQQLRYAFVFYFCVYWLYHNEKGVWINQYYVLAVP